MNKKYNSNLIGVGGWLAFLIFSLMVLSPLFGLSGTHTAILNSEAALPGLSASPQWEITRKTLWLIAIAQSATLFCAGLLLFKTRLTSTPKKATALLWIGGPIITFAGNFLVILQTNQSIGNIFGPDAIGGVIGSAVSALIWSLYLARSVRVKNTYSQHAPQ